MSDRCILPYEDPATGKRQRLDFPSHNDALAWLRHMTAMVERDQAHRIYQNGLAFLDTDPPGLS